MPKLGYFVILQTEIMPFGISRNIKYYQEVWKNLSVEILWIFFTAGHLVHLRPRRADAGAHGHSKRKNKYWVLSTAQYRVHREWHRWLLHESKTKRNAFSCLGKQASFGNFESWNFWIRRGFCGVNDFLSNPAIFPLANFWVCRRTKLADWVMVSQSQSHGYCGGRWLPHSVTDRSRQSFIIGNAVFLRNQNYRREQCWLHKKDYCCSSW